MKLQKLGLYLWSLHSLIWGNLSNSSSWFIVFILQSKRLIRKSNHSLVGMLFLISISSCVGPKELVTLNANDNVPEGIRSIEIVSTAKPYEFQPYKIKAYDQLMIKINAFDGSTEEFLSREFSSENTFSSNINYDAASLYFNSYEVDETGYIILPMIGRTKVTGLSLLDLKNKLDKDYEPYLKFTNSSVKLSNRRFTIFGEVNNPGVHYLYNEKNTLFDAIGLAGDFTDFGNRKKVKIIRQTNHGSETTYLNLSQSDFMFTPYYYVQPNDVIYVEPLKAKSKEVSSRTLGVVFSGISVGVLLLNLFIR